MTEEQVERILGKEQGPLPTGGVCGSTVWTGWRYYDYGVFISFMGHGGKPSRPATIAFWPLLLD